MAVSLIVSQPRTSGEAGEGHGAFQEKRGEEDAACMHVHPHVASSLAVQQLDLIPILSP